MFRHVAFEGGEFGVSRRALLTQLHAAVEAEGRGDLTVTVAIAARAAHVMPLENSVTFRHCRSRVVGRESVYSKVKVVVAKVGGGGGGQNKLATERARCLATSVA